MWMQSTLVSRDDIYFYAKKKKGSLKLVKTPSPALEYPLADTHAHIEMVPDRSLVLARAAFYGIRFICNMVEVSEDADTGYDLLDDWQAEAEAKLAELQREYRTYLDEPDDSEDNDLFYEIDGYPVSQPVIPDIRVAIGCHPHNASLYTDEVERLLIARLADPRTCALGEVGLDYYYDHSPRDVQQEVFRRQIRIVHKTGLPLILHLRDAHEDAYTIMCEEGFPQAGVLLHCFNQDWETVEPWVRKGCFVALGGALTFGRSEDTRDAVKRIPDSQLLTETDTPYMAPEPMRGRSCEPAHTIFTAACMTELKECQPGESRKDFLRHIYENARALLDREPTTWQREAQKSTALQTETQKAARG